MINVATNYGECSICGKHYSFAAIPKPTKKDPSRKVFLCLKAERLRKSKIRKERQTSRSKVAKKCDILFSKLVRAIGHCEFQQFGGCSSQLQCAHLVSRRHRATRWEPDNAICLCALHHREGHEKPHLFAQRVEQIWPGRWELVDGLLKRPSPDPADVLLELQKMESAA